MAWSRGHGVVRVHSEGGSRGRKIATEILITLTIFGITGVAFWLRYLDARAFLAMPAEDPYTQVLLAREHLVRGFFAPSYWLGMDRLYPVGLGAFLGVVSALTGVPPIEIARWGAAAFGAIGVAGVALFAWREAGPVAGVTSGALLATAPEHVFRSSLWVPTALDLALIPWFLLAMTGAARGRRAWLVIVTLVGVAVTISHPWTSIILVGACIIFVSLRLIFVSAQAPDFRHGCALMIAAMLIAVIGGIDVLQQDGDKGVAPSAYAAMTAAGLSVVLFALLARWGRASFIQVPHERLRGATGLAVSGILAAVVTVVVVAALEKPLAHVDYVHMLRGGLLAGAVLGLALALPARNPLVVAAVSLAAVTVPITLIDWSGLWYLPHRTVVYVSIAAALLSGFGAQALVTHGRAMFARHATVPTVRWRRSRARAALAVVLLVAGPVAAAPAATHHFTWDRYFADDDYALLAEGVAASRDGALVVGSWQANLYGKTDARDPLRVHIRGEFFVNPHDRERLIARYPAPLYVFVDSYTERLRGFDDSFLAPGTYELVRASGHARLYVLTEAPA